MQHGRPMLTARSKSRVFLRLQDKARYPGCAPGQALAAARRLERPLSRVSAAAALRASGRVVRGSARRNRGARGRQFNLDAQRPWQRCGGCAQRVGRAEGDLPHRRSIQHHQSSVIRPQERRLCCALGRQDYWAIPKSRCCSCCTSAAPPSAHSLALCFSPLPQAGLHQSRAPDRLPTFPPLAFGTATTRHSSLPPATHAR